MEQKIKQRIQDHTINFKNSIKKWLETNNIKTYDENGKLSNNDLLEFIYDYNDLELTNNDFQKRTRAKNNIPNYERCCALRLNGERCTRKKKNADFCGTHIKGIPNGSIEEKQSSNNLKVEIWIEEIKGIHQWIDANHNVYSTPDITNNVVNPKIISSWNKTENGEYFIVNK
jgi:hypothetical protein